MGRTNTNINQTTKMKTTEPTPFEQYETESHRAFDYDYDAHLEDGIEDNFRSIMPRVNGTKAGFDALRISLERNTTI